MNINLPVIFQPFFSFILNKLATSSRRVKQGDMYIYYVLTFIDYPFMPRVFLEKFYPGL